MQNNTQELQALQKYLQTILPEWHLTLVQTSNIHRPMIIFCKNHNQPNCTTAAMFLDDLNLKDQINLNEIDFTNDQTTIQTINKHLTNIKTNYYHALCQHNNNHTDHHWWTWNHQKCCKKCGIIQNRNNTNKPCIGIVKIKPRHNEPNP